MQKLLKLVLWSCCYNDFKSQPPQHLMLKNQQTKFSSWCLATSECMVKHFNDIYKKKLYIWNTMCDAKKTRHSDFAENSKSKKMEAYFKIKSQLESGLVSTGLISFFKFLFHICNFSSKTASFRPYSLFLDFV